MFSVAGALDSQLLDGNSSRVLQALAPLFRREIQILRTNQIAYQAAFVRLGHFRPPRVMRDVQSVGFVENNGRTRQQIIEEVLFSASCRRVEFPSWKQGDAC